MFLLDLTSYSIIVSIPIDPTSLGDGALATPQLKGVQGRYVSVERLLELEDGRTEWKMATSSDPGGLIPSFLAESMLPSKIAQVYIFPTLLVVLLNLLCILTGCSSFHEVVASWTKEVA